MGLFSGKPGGTGVGNFLRGVFGGGSKQPFSLPNTFGKGFPTTPTFTPSTGANIGGLIGNVAGGLLFPQKDDSGFPDKTDVFTAGQKSNPIALPEVKITPKDASNSVSPILVKLGDIASYFGKRTTENAQVGLDSGTKKLILAGLGVALIFVFAKK